LVRKDRMERTIFVKIYRDNFETEKRRYFASKG
jgi:ribosomal protein S17